MKQKENAFTTLESTVKGKEKVKIRKKYSGHATLNARREQKNITAQVWNIEQEPRGL